ncbi:MAG: hypothetical protein ACTSVY_12100, partial [Candidatus Helarchaeota archaeon]
SSPKSLYYLRTIIILKVAVFLQLGVGHVQLFPRKIKRLTLNKKFKFLTLSLMFFLVFMPFMAFIQIDTKVLNKDSEINLAT